jgi:hypothetical protein
MGQVLARAPGDAEGLQLMQEQGPKAEQQFVEIRSVAQRTEGSRNHGMLNAGGTADLEPLAVQEGPASVMGSVELVEEGVVDHSHHRLFFYEEADRDLVLDV